MRTQGYPIGVTGPPPLWAIDRAANELEQQRRRHVAEARAAVDTLVTKHPTAWLGEPVTAAARTLERLAQSKGMTTRLHTYLDGCVLEGRVPGERRGFRARWHRGKADAAWWYEPVEEWRTEPDTRPVGLSKTTRTTLAGHRHPGIDSRTFLVSSPNGVLVPFAQLSARVKALP
ncbi:MAG: hypothetical protein M3Y29_06395 [Chloroflexota bacterium]|nr:hypothetical protein [Chloroflexota bacterium]